MPRVYSTPHLMADWLDSGGIAQRTRDRILGHDSDVRGRYGREGILDPQTARKIEALEPLVVKQMRKLLLAAKSRADTGELNVLKTSEFTTRGTMSFGLQYLNAD